MEHKTVTVDMVHNFAWCDTRKEALETVKRLEAQGITVYYGGKHAKSKFTYLDIKIAAIYQDKWSGNDCPWIVAW